MYKIAVIPGDGTGPEVVAEGLKVLKAVSEKYKFKYQLEHYDLGGDRYLKTKETLPISVFNELKKMDAIYLGAIGHPDVKPGILERGNSAEHSISAGSIYQSQACQTLPWRGNASQR